MSFAFSRSATIAGATRSGAPAVRICQMRGHAVNCTSERYSDSFLGTPSDRVQQAKAVIAVALAHASEFIHVHGMAGLTLLWFQSPP